MKPKTFKVYAGDFETTVYKGQEHTEVWASGCLELFTEEPHIFHSIEEQFDYFLEQKCNIIVYYHNLKFDGSFWLDYLISQKGYQQAYKQTGEYVTDIEWIPDKDMPNESVKYTISDRGQWYTIKIKKSRHLIEFRDSLKLLPFSLERIGKSFDTKHKKLDMEYTGFRYAGCVITDDERKYLENDLYVLKEALEIMFTDGHNKLTIGACCLAEYKRLKGKEYNYMFPDLTKYTFETGKFEDPNVDEWIRKSYKGGWCYLVKGKENKIFENGITLDVNSLYPSMMSSESGNRYPIGEPTFWEGNFIPDEAIVEDKYFFVRIKTRFYLRPNKLPFIQIKSSFLYKGTEMLETSDVYDPITNTYHSETIDDEGNIHDTRLELTFTMTDYKLFLEHYEPVDFEILGGCFFDSEIGIFDTYINHYKTIKLQSTGAKRELAKLFLNNLYGKMASSTHSDFKVAYIKEDKVLGFFPVIAEDKKAGYIPVGSAITSYARNFTIRTAQKNYHGKDKAGFIYADTDSIHCDLPLNKITGVTLHDKNFCCWKAEANWDKAIFARQKTYIEHVTHENLKPIPQPYYNVKCAGMPDRCKKLLVNSIERKMIKGVKYTKEEMDFILEERGLKDFKVGLKVPSKLLPKRIRGGIVLNETTYEMR